MSIIIDVKQIKEGTKMAFLVIVLSALIATAIMESDFMVRNEFKAEINRLADRSLKNPVTSRRKRCKYFKAYNPMLNMEGKAK